MEKIKVDMKDLRLGIVVLLFSLVVYLFFFFNIYMSFEINGSVKEIYVFIVYLALVGQIIGVLFINAAFTGISSDEKSSEFITPEIQKLNELKKARDMGLITDQEFEDKKREILSQI